MPPRTPRVSTSRSWSTAPRSSTTWWSTSSGACHSAMACCCRATCRTTCTRSGASIRATRSSSCALSGASPSGRARRTAARISRSRSVAGFRRFWTRHPLRADAARTGRAALGAAQRSLVYLPLLAGRAAAGRDDQGHPFFLGTGQRVEALAADAEHLAVGERPVLARAAVAGHRDDASAIGRCAAHDVEAAAADPRDLAVGDIPVLLLLADALAQPYLRAVNRVAVPGHQHALVGVGHDQHVAAGAGRQHHRQRERAQGSPQQCGQARAHCTDHCWLGALPPVLRMSGVVSALLPPCRSRHLPPSPTSWPLTTCHFWLARPLH